MYQENSANSLQKSHRIGERENSPRYLTAGIRPLIDVYDTPTYLPVLQPARVEYKLMPLSGGFFFRRGTELSEVKVSRLAIRKNQIITASEEEFEVLLCEIAVESNDLDSESKLHEIRSSFVVRYLAELIGVDQKSSLYRYLAIGALIHDNGKGDKEIKKRIRIKGQLSDNDRAITHLHPLLGTVNAFINGLEEAAEYSLTHHVFYDRSTGHMRGYPDNITDRALTAVRKIDSDGNVNTIADEMNLSEEERAQYIFFKELLKVTDEFDAFCSLRVYRNFRLTRSELQAHLEKNSGTRFNPDAVNLVLDHIDELRFFHYLMYRLHNGLVSEMSLSSVAAFIEKPAQLERTVDGQISINAAPPIRVTWTEMQNSDVRRIMLASSALYKDFVSNTREKYRAKLRQTMTV